MLELGVDVLLLSLVFVYTAVRMSSQAHSVTCVAPSFCLANDSCLYSSSFFPNVWTLCGTYAKKKAWELDVLKQYADSQVFS